MLADSTFLDAFGIQPAVIQVEPGCTADGTAEVQLVLQHAFLLTATDQRVHTLLSLLLIIFTYTHGLSF